MLVYLTTKTILIFKKMVFCPITFHPLKTVYTKVYLKCIVVMYRGKITLVILTTTLTMSISTSKLLNLLCQFLMDLVLHIIAVRVV